MHPTRVSSNSKGFSLVEVMIAMVVLLLIALAVGQTALVSIDSNMVNVLRDEAISVADARMNQLRNTPYESLGAGVTVWPSESRVIRNIASFNYEVSSNVTWIPSTAPDVKRIDVTVRWDWKEKTIAKGDPYTHTISTIVREQ